MSWRERHAVIIVRFYPKRSPSLSSSTHKNHESRREEKRYLEVSPPFPSLINPCQYRQSSPLSQVDSEREKEREVFVPNSFFLSPLKQKLAEGERLKTDERRMETLVLSLWPPSVCSSESKNKERPRSRYGCDALHHDPMRKPQNLFSLGNARTQMASPPSSSFPSTPRSGFCAGERKKGKKVAAIFLPRHKSMRSFLSGRSLTDCHGWS